MMFDLAFFLAHFTVLMFGAFFSAAFSDLQLTKKNVIIYSVFIVCTSSLQMLVLYIVGEDMVWKTYPLLIHLPLIAVLCFYYKKRLFTVLISVTTAYLLCQPARFVGLLALYVTERPISEYIGRFLMLLITAIVLMRYCVRYLIQLYSKDARILTILGILPISYYLFDYSFRIYENSWTYAPFIAQELLPLLLVFIHLTFCNTYYREYELRQVAEQKEMIIQAASYQQAKEIDEIKRSTHELHLLRHDMRHLLNSVNVCLEANDTAKAKELISGYISHIDLTVVTRYCQNDTLNYIASSFVSKCEQYDIPLQLSIEIDELHFDEISFCSILTNAFDNAFNSQLDLPKEKRLIKLSITEFNRHTLISIKNTFFYKPVFVDGIPVSKRKGHGYGTQSIRYLTEKLGGNYQFSIQNDMFVLRLVL